VVGGTTLYVCGSRIIVRRRGAGLSRLYEGGGMIFMPFMLAVISGRGRHGGVCALFLPGFPCCCRTARAQTPAGTPSLRIARMHAWMLGWPGARRQSPRPAALCYLFAWHGDAAIAGPLARAAKRHVWLAGRAACASRRLAPPPPHAWRSLPGCCHIIDTECRGTCSVGSNMSLPARIALPLLYHAPATCADLPRFLPCQRGGLYLRDVYGGTAGWLPAYAGLPCARCPTVPGAYPYSFATLLPQRLQTCCLQVTSHLQRRRAAARFSFRCNAAPHWVPAAALHARCGAASSFLCSAVTPTRRVPGYHLLRAAL